MVQQQQCQQKHKTIIANNKETKPITPAKPPISNNRVTKNSNAKTRTNHITGKKTAISATMEKPKQKYHHQQQQRRHQQNMYSNRDEAYQGFSLFSRNLSISAYIDALEDDYYDESSISSYESDTYYTNEGSSYYVA